MHPPVVVTANNACRFRQRGGDMSSSPVNTIFRNTKPSATTASVEAPALHYVPPLHHCPVRGPRKRGCCYHLSTTTIESANSTERMDANTVLVAAPWRTRWTSRIPKPSHHAKHRRARMMWWLATMSKTWYAGENNVSGYEYIGVRSAPSVSTVRDVGNSSDRDCLPYRCMHPTGYRHALLTCDSPIG